MVWLGEKSDPDSEKYIDDSADVWKPGITISLLVIRRRDLCEAKHETQSVFKFGRPGGRSTGRYIPLYPKHHGNNFYLAYEPPIK